MGSSKLLYNKADSTGHRMVVIIFIITCEQKSTSFISKENPQLRAKFILHRIYKLHFLYRNTLFVHNLYLSKTLSLSGQLTDWMLPCHNAAGSCVHHKVETG